MAVLHNCLTSDGGSSPSLVNLASKCKMVLCKLHMFVPSYFCMKRKTQLYSFHMLVNTTDARKSCDQAMIKLSGRNEFFRDPADHVSHLTTQTTISNNCVHACKLASFQFYSVRI